MSRCTSRRPDRVLTLREAAEILYKTKRPTAQQIRRLRERFERGAPTGENTAEHGCRTTAADVAAYMAGQAYLRQLHDLAEPHQGDLRAAAAGKQPHQPPRKEYAPLRAVYQQILKEYFLALICRRQRRHATKAFRRAVVVGQAGVVLLTVAILAASLQSLGAPFLSDRPPECAIVEQWLAEKEPDFSIARWHPVVQSAGEEGVSVRVEYSYTTSQGKTIDTDRIFVIQDGHVVSESSTP